MLGCPKEGVVSSNPARKRDCLLASLGRSLGRWKLFRVLLDSLGGGDLQEKGHGAGHAKNHTRDLGVEITFGAHGADCAWFSILERDRAILRGETHFAERLELPV